MLSPGADQLPSTDEAGGAALFLVGISTATCTLQPQGEAGGSQRGGGKAGRSMRGERVAPTGPCRRPLWDTAASQGSSPAGIYLLWGMQAPISGTCHHGPLTLLSSLAFPVTRSFSDTDTLPGVD